MAVRVAPKIVLRTRPSTEHFPSEAFRIDAAAKVGGAAGCDRWRGCSRGAVAARARAPLARRARAA